MSTIQAQILDSFCERLVESGEVPSQAVEELRALLDTDKKPKPDQLEKLFSSVATGREK